MPSPVEIAVDTYIRACTTRDAALRTALFEQCFAPDGRMVTRSGELRGPAAIDAMLTRFWANPESLRLQLISVVDARGTTFRYRALAELRDGTKLEAFDPGEIDAAGQISLILTFAGPLADASEQPAPG